MSDERARPAVSVLIHPKGHLNLTYQVDFDNHVLKGKVALTVEVLEDKFSVLTLDTKDLKILKVSANGQTAKFALGAKHSYKGSPLEITLPLELSRGQHVIVEIEYETSPRASALQWLSPAQTAGKKQPYLFSQCQATHCRTLVPCQDTPSVKHTYYAQVSVPKELVALMSAVQDGQEPDPNDTSRVIYRFRQPVPMPSYLIALVVGALESRVIGPRSKVWSEKEYVDKAAFEFSETEMMLKTAESLAGPYVWGQYDLLILPPSFPYGGMENPCLTFVTPTLLVRGSFSGFGWTGNLVTNKTWEHFWLNEGHTVYLERMIGRALESEQFRQFKAMGGWKELHESIERFGANNVLTNLVPSLQDVNPDDSFSSVPYEKGFALLYYLEELMGGPEVFMGFVKSYIQLFAYSSVTTQEWKDHLFTYFKDKVREDLFCGKLYVPPFQQPYQTSLLQLMDPLPLSHVKRMQEVHHFNSIANSEIRCRWLRLCVRAQWEEAVPLALKMAVDQGRMKFTRPLFRDVYNVAKFRDASVKAFKEHSATMHPVTATMVAKDLNVEHSTGL
uniref:Leukotriene A-4 hydrolase n=1 Tax=Electrophorus electricus TaxID=8005 RepID=A0A4W4F817_ELEEL